METIAIIDTETNWFNELMSIGIIIADAITFDVLEKRYYIITPAYLKDGMYSNALFIKDIKVDDICLRPHMIKETKELFKNYQIKAILAYNANFDYHVLHELQDYCWKDIMSLAAYKQYNNKIEDYMECFKTGRLKRNYGVEPIYRLLSNNYYYKEKHNALYDAIDEFEIVKMLGYEISMYKTINKASTKMR